MAGEPFCIVCFQDFRDKYAPRRLTWAHDSCMRKLPIDERAAVVRQIYLIDKEIAAELAFEEYMSISRPTDESRMLKAMENFARVATQDSRDRKLIMRQLGEIAKHGENTSENVKAIAIEIVQWCIDNKVIAPPPGGFPFPPDVDSAE